MIFCCCYTLNCSYKHLNESCIYLTYWTSFHCVSTAVPENAEIAPGRPIKHPLTSAIRPLYYTVLYYTGLFLPHLQFGSVAAVGTVHGIHLILVSLRLFVVVGRKFHFCLFTKNDARTFKQNS